MASTALNCGIGCGYLPSRRRRLIHSTRLQNSRSLEQSHHRIADEHLSWFFWPVIVGVENSFCCNLISCVMNPIAELVNLQTT